MPMRVIAGEYRHRKLVYPENNPSIRPTKDRIREAVFSSLGDLNNLTFLDLYAGCGSIGIEAISRGASKVYFVDYDDNALKYVRENVNSLGVNDKGIILKSNDIDAIKKFVYSALKFDIIYFDPPYESDCYKNALPLIFEYDLLANNGVLLVESKLPIEINPIWNVDVKEYHYGEITIYKLRKKL